MKSIYNHKAFSFLSLIVYSMGVVAGMALFGFAAWGDLEASLFEPTVIGSSPYSGLTCPVMISSSEIGKITTKFSNPTESKISPVARILISKGYLSLFRELRTDLVLAPGESKNFEWEVYPGDAAFGNVILVKAYVFSQYPLPISQGTCGILVIQNSLLSGNQIFSLIFLTSVIAMVLGLGMWKAGHQESRHESEETSRALTTLSVLVFIGMIASILDWWIFTGIILLFAFMVVGAMVYMYVISQ